MCTVEYEKVKNMYNEIRKVHQGMDTSSLHDPPAQDMKVHEEEHITGQARKVANTRRIMYNSTGESSRI